MKNLKLIPMLMPSYSTEFDPKELRPFSYDGDNMHPTIKRKDVMLIQPVDTYIGEGVYAISQDDESIALFRVDAMGGVRLMSDNPVYRYSHRLTKEQFSNAVLGKVRFICQYTT